MTFVRNDAGKCRLLHHFARLCHSLSYHARADSMLTVDVYFGDVRLYVPFLGAISESDSHPPASKLVQLLLLESKGYQGQADPLPENL